MSEDASKILRAYLVAQTGLTDIVGDAIYVARLPEKATLPALGFFVRGGTSTPYIPPIVEPSFQFDCWGTTAMEARSVYTALYDCLQGVQDKEVTVSGVTYRLLSAIEEVQGYDIQDVDYPGYFRVVSFSRVMLEI